ncbi:MAG: DoxX family protein [Bacteroidia bacterium]
MKKINILYWVFTGTFGAFMLFSAIPDIMNTKEAVDFMTGLLGYPKYFTPFIGVAKVLGVAGILIPGYPRIKEWAYAGLAFDLIGATYSVIAVGSPVSGWIVMVLFLVWEALSYIFYHKKLKLSNGN